MDELDAFLERRLGPGARVEHRHRVSTGRSRENWLFDAVWSDGDTVRREPLIVRRDPLGSLIETDRSLEFNVLRALEPTPVPAPRVKWLDATGDELGRPSLVMVRVEGVCDYHALSSSAPIEDRVDLARRLCSLLSTVHDVDWAGIGLGHHLRDPGPDAAVAALDEWEATLRRDQLQPWAPLDLGAEWLRAHAPVAASTVLVHADFKPGNVLVLDGQITALLDWELAHLGDFHEDLGWVTQPLRRREHQIPGAWEVDQLISHYESVSGRSVERASLRWWNTFSTWKTGVMQVSGLRAFVEGRSAERYEPTDKVLRTLLTAIDATDATGQVTP